MGWARWMPDNLTRVRLGLLWRVVVGECIQAVADCRAGERAMDDAPRRRMLEAWRMVRRSVSHAARPCVSEACGPAGKIKQGTKRGTK